MELNIGQSSSLVKMRWHDPLSTSILSTNLHAKTSLFLRRGKKLTTAQVELW